MIFGAGISCTSKRAKRETSSVYVAPPAAGIRPSSPLFVTLSGTTVTWELPETLVGGGDIADDPVLSCTVYWGDEPLAFDLSNAVGSQPVAAPGTSYTIPGLTPSSALHVFVTASNSAGEGNPSPEDSGIVP